MRRTGVIFDLWIGESLNGGDLQQIGNDLGVVFGNENQVILAFLGGNVEEDTSPQTVNGNRKDYWGNYLYKNDPDKQFNSKTERALNTTELSSSGRIKIENTAKDDLKFLKPIAEVKVSVTIPKPNTVVLSVKLKYNTGKILTTIITYTRRGVIGDFVYDDFNDDFF